MRAHLPEWVALHMSHFTKNTLPHIKLKHSEVIRHSSFIKGHFFFVSYFAHLLFHFLSFLLPFFLSCFPSLFLSFFASSFFLSSFFISSFLLSFLLSFFLFYFLFLTFYCLSLPFNTLLVAGCNRI